MSYITIFTVVVTVLFFGYLQYLAMVKYAEQSIGRIEHQISAISHYLDELPVDVECNKALISRLAKEVYDDVNVRALGFQAQGSDILCTSHGEQNISLDEQYWDRALGQGATSLAMNKGFKFGRQHSLIVVHEQDDHWVLAAVNPIIVNKLWIDDEFELGEYALYLNNVAHPVYSSSPTEQQGLLSLDIQSERYPFHFTLNVRLPDLIKKAAGVLLLVIFLYFSFSRFILHFKASYKNTEYDY